MHLPLPPPELRRLVGPVEDHAFDNPEGKPVFGQDVPLHATRRVFDFGCGVGRTARQLLLQNPPPEAYLGVDLNPVLIRWAQTHLTAAAPQARFAHLDVFNWSFNPGLPFFGRRYKKRFRPFPAPDGAFTLVNAHSVFTHILEREVPRYLLECARVLEPGGWFRSTWFTFDKSEFPMMQAFQNGLYVNYDDPTNATIYDRAWIGRAAAAAGLRITAIIPPAIRGFHWVLVMRKEAGDHIAWPADAADDGACPPPHSHKPGDYEII